MNLFEQLTVIDIFRLLPLIVIFFYAGYKDHKTGEVTNKIWLYAPVGFTIALTEIVFYASNMLIFDFISLIVCVIIALVLFYIPHGWGGADAKALITLAMCYPVAPAYQAWLPLYPMLIFGVASAIAVAMMIFRKQKTIRFLPYLFIAMIIVAVI